MAENTNIEWADHTFNPWIGCTKVSPACDHCYAEEWDKRFHDGKHWGPHGYRKRTSAANWRQPLKWDAAAKAAGQPAFVFCASLADVFDNAAAERDRHDLWHLIHRTPNLIWLLLTKRPQNIAKMLPADWGAGWGHVWLGATVENQAEADRRIPHLLAVPAAKRFLSMEPLLGPVDLSTIWLRRDGETGTELSRRLGDYVRPLQGNFTDSPKIDWVISGGESGPKARPSHPDWFRSLRDQCQAASVPFHFKQHGEWIDFEDAINIDGIDILKAPTCGDGGETGIQFIRGGKAKTGRLLDGVLHDGRPEA